MRYHEFKVVNEDFWDSVFDLLQGGKTADVAQKKWVQGLYERLSTLLQTAISSGMVNPRLTTTLDPKDPEKLISPSNGTDRSISQYIYSLIKKQYGDLFPLSIQDKEHLSTAINKIQNEYSVDQGKKAILRLGAVISTISDSGEKEQPQKPVQTSVPKSMTPDPTSNVTVKARVGNAVQQFTFDDNLKQWKDQAGAVITDAESIDALNGIAKAQAPTKPPVTSPAPRPKP
jgi:hypothetical protein